jgi:hypothetical protein
MKEKKIYSDMIPNTLNDDSALSPVTKGNRAINTIRDSMEYQDSEYMIYKLLMR